MSNLLNDISNSSDSDDSDYVPTKEDLKELSEDELEIKEEISTDITNVKEDKNSNNDSITNPLSVEEEKKRTEALWKNFLDDVNKNEPQKNQKTVLKSQISSVASKSPVKDSSEKSQPVKKTITENYEFAGEIVSITKEVDSSKNSPTDNTQKVADNNTSKSENSNARKRTANLNSLVGKLTNKKQKMTILQKSLHDWNNFKKDEGIDEELKTFNKGKGGYLEKQAFLERSDLRQFELEKNLRLSKKKI